MNNSNHQFAIRDRVYVGGERGTVTGIDTYQKATDRRAQTYLTVLFDDGREREVWAMRAYRTGK